MTDREGSPVIDPSRGYIVDGFHLSSLRIAEQLGRSGNEESAPITKLTEKTCQVYTSVH